MAGTSPAKPALITAAAPDPRRFGASGHGAIPSRPRFDSDVAHPARVYGWLGSFIAVSHLTADFAPEQVSSGVAAYNTLVPAGITARSHAGVTALFGGLPLVAPGVVPVAQWRPDTGCWPDQSADLYAGLATTARRSR
jgi:hypothetical protein